MTIKCIHKNKKLQLPKSIHTENPPPLTSVPSNPILCLANNQNTCIASFSLRFDILLRSCTSIHLTSSISLDILVISRICKYKWNSQEHTCAISFWQGKLPEVKRNRYFMYWYVLLNCPPESSHQFLLLLNWETKYISLLYCASSRISKVRHVFMDCFEHSHLYCELPVYILWKRGLFVFE